MVGLCGLGTASCLRHLVSRVVPPLGSAEVVLLPLRPVVPASEEGANAAVCLAGAAELGVDVAGLSLPVCPRVTAMVVLFWSGFGSLRILDQHDAGHTMVSTQVVFSHN